MATKLQEILLKGNTTNASAVPSSLKVREIAINALDRSLFTNDGNSIVKLYTGTNKWFDVNGNANNALKLGGILASEYINKEAFNSHINNSIIHITATERTKWNNKWDYNEETIKGVKVNAAVSADKLTSNAGTSAIPIYFKNGKPAQCIPSDLFSGFDNAYSSTGEHSLGITIAGNTRMVVVAYSTLSEKANKLATPRTLWGKPFDGSANVSGDLKDVGNITASGKATIQGDIISGGEVVAVVGDGTPAGVTDYSALTGKPSINGVTLISGNNTLAALGIQAAGDYATNSGVTNLLANYTTKTFVENNYAGKSAFNNHTANSNIHITSAERTAWNAKWNYNEATIKAVKVTSASSADSVAWSGIKDKPSTFTPSAHTHTASDVSGLPTKLSAFTNDAGFITGITKSMVEGVLTGDITSHTHSQYLTSALRPAKYATTNSYTSGYYKIKITKDSSWMLSFDVKIYQNYDAYTIRFSGYNFSNTGQWLHPSASIIDGQNSIGVKFGYDSAKNLWVAIPAGNYAGISITNVANGFWQVDINALDKLFIITYEETLSGTTQETITLYPPSKSNHTHTFASITSKPTTISGYGITDALTTSNYNSYSPKLDGTGASGTWGISISGNAATATNADALDGLDSTNFVHNIGRTSTNTERIDANNVWTNSVKHDYRWTNTPIDTIASLLDLSYSDDWRSQIFVLHTNKTYIAIRSRYEGTTWGNWRELAFTDSNITGNAASATKLQDNTAFTAWGQTFFENGKPKNVSDNLSMEWSKIYWNGDIKGSYISSNGLKEMIYEMRGGHTFRVGGDVRMRITKDGNVRVYGDLIVDGEVSALVA